MDNLIITHGFEANYTVGFLKGLSVNGVRFTALSADDVDDRLRANQIPHLNIRGSQDADRSAPAKAVGIVAYYIKLFWQIVRHTRRTQHFTGVLSRKFVVLDALLLAAWIRIWSRCFIYTAHNTLPHSRKDSAFFRRIYRLFYRFPHVIVVHSTQVAQQLENEFGVPAKAIRYISIGLNEEVPETGVTHEESRAALGFAKTDRIALFFGKVEPYKGVDTLIEAWGRLHDRGIKLAIAGWAPNASYADQISKQIAASPVGQSITWTADHIPNEKVELWLKACDTVVMPYRYIYQSGVVFLCLRFGVPIVATRVGSLPDFIDAHSGILSATNDASGIAAAVDAFFQQPARFSRQDIAQRAARFGWDQQCAKIKDLYS